VTQLVELIRGNIEPIGGTAAFTRCIFQDHKLSLALDGSPTTGRDFALHQLEEPPDAVGVVNYKIPGVE
jgi:hypothetical protein